MRRPASGAGGRRPASGAGGLLACARQGGPLVPVLVVVALVLGLPSSVGAQVDPVFPKPQAVWAASCVPPGATELVAYGRGWEAGAVSLAVTDQAGATVGGLPATAAARAAEAVFQARVPLAVPAGASSLRLVATQGGRTAEHTLAVGSCTPTIAAVIDAIPCALPGRPVSVTVTVRGAPGSVYDLLLHHADLYGPAEAVDRSQPPRPDGDYAFPLTVPNVPDRLVPVTVEARRRDGSFAFATTTVRLPPTCTQPTPPTTGPPAPGTTAPTTAPPSSAATTVPPTPGATTTLAPTSGRPRLPTGSVPGSLVLSPALGPTGGAATVFGRGFVASTVLTLRWRPGIGQWTVTVAADGTFRTQVLVLPKDVEGRRVLEVVGGGAPAAPYLVVPGSDQPAFGGVFVRS